MHSISELADLAKSRLSMTQQGFPAGPQQDNRPRPQQGWEAEPQAGPLPGPGYAGQPRSGPLPGNWSRGRPTFGDSIGDDIGQDITDVALGAAARFIGRAISRRVQQTVNERVLPTVATHQQAMLNEQVAIAERYPELRACLDDKVIFLAGGNRVVPMVNLATVTLAQADAIVAQLREG